MTEKITLGVSVLVLPYRHPLYWTRVAVSIERLAKGRLIMGVGIGWMEEEFEALGVPFKDRGRMTDEQLQIIARLWTEEHVNFDGPVLSIPRPGFLSQADAAAAHPDMGGGRRDPRPEAHGKVR